MTNIFALDAVQRCIIQPMIDRGWTAPKGNQKVIIGDYADILKRFPAEVLTKGFRAVLETHKYRNWPSPAVFLEACKQFYYDEPEPVSVEYLSDIQRTQAAGEYVERRLAAGNWKLLVQGIQGWFLPQLRKYLFDQACDCLRRGEEIHVPEWKLEEKLVAWTADYGEVNDFWRGKLKGNMPIPRELRT